MSEDNEKIILEKARRLSPQHLREALDFIDFLQKREKGEEWMEFDEWALNLAKTKGFDRLTEEDVAKIVGAHRKQGAD